MIKPTRIHAIFPGGFQEFIGVTDVRDEPKGRKSVSAFVLTARLPGLRPLTWHTVGAVPPWHESFIRLPATNRLAHNSCRSEVDKYTHRDFLVEVGLCYVSPVRQQNDFAVRVPRSSSSNASATRSSG